MMRKASLLLMILTLVAASISCRSGKEVSYLSDATYDSAYAITGTYSTVLHKGDRLYIHVDSESAESVIAFNQETNKLLNTAMDNEQRMAQMAQQGLVAVKDSYGFGGAQGYLVDQLGNITFPILGTIHVEGICQDTLAARLQTRLIREKYVSDPVVTIRLMNFHVSVVGEVNMPMRVYAVGERLTVLEALAQAGDVSFYGRRDSIRIVRDNGTGVRMGSVDLTKTEFLNSPYYYLQPNDIVYVEANKQRKHEARDEEFVENVGRYANIMNSAIVAARQLEQAQQATSNK